VISLGDRKEIMKKALTVLASLALVATFGFGVANAMSISQHPNIQVETPGATGASGATGSSGQHEDGAKSENDQDKAENDKEDGPSAQSDMPQGQHEDANDTEGQQGEQDRDTEQDGEFEGDN
jgi:hypothetical protein